LTGKKIKLSYEEKVELIRLAQEKRDVYENKNLGNFTKIYPVDVNIKIILNYFFQIKKLKNNFLKKIKKSGCRIIN
jgi:hypothetical protein